MMPTFQLFKNKNGPAFEKGSIPGGGKKLPGGYGG